VDLQLRPDPRDRRGFKAPLFLALGAEYRKNTLEIAAGQPESYIDGKYVAPAGLPNAGPSPRRRAGRDRSRPHRRPFRPNNVSVYANGEQTRPRPRLSVAGRRHYSDFGDA